MSTSTPREENTNGTRRTLPSVPTEGGGRVEGSTRDGGGGSVVTGEIEQLSSSQSTIKEASHRYGRELFISSMRIYPTVPIQ